LAPSPPFTGDVHRNGKRGERARVKALSLMNFSCPLRLSKEPDAGYYNLGFEKKGYSRKITIALMETRLL
jgi:hypothetical protein